jgi:hypothetical protein
LQQLHVGDMWCLAPWYRLSLHLCDWHSSENLPCFVAIYSWFVSAQDWLRYPLCSNESRRGVDASSPSVLQEQHCWNYQSAGGELWGLCELLHGWISATSCGTLTHREPDIYHSVVVEISGLSLSLTHPLTHTHTHTFIASPIRLFYRMTLMKWTKIHTHYLILPYLFVWWAVALSCNQFTNNNHV